MNYSLAYESDKVIPGEKTLCIEINGCCFDCPDCDLKYLDNEIGIPLTPQVLDLLIKGHRSVSAVCFLGGDTNPHEIDEIASYVRKMHPDLKIGWYSGADELTIFTNTYNFDFIKLGRYIKRKGRLNSRSTNQKFYKVENGMMRNMTHQFWIR